MKVKKEKNWTTNLRIWSNEGRNPQSRTFCIFTQKEKKVKTRQIVGRKREGNQRIHSAILSYFDIYWMSLRVILRVCQGRSNRADPKTVWNFIFTLKPKRFHDFFKKFSNHRVEAFDPIFGLKWKCLRSSHIYYLLTLLNVF